jgi:hypothetical protein
VATKPNYIEPVFPIVKNERGENIHQTPEQLHDGIIRGEGPAAERARQAFKAVSNTLANLNAQHVAMHPDFKDNLERGYRETISSAIEQARSGFKAEVAELEKALVEKTGFKVDPTRRNYVVGTFSAMQPNERVNAISKLIEGGHGPELAILDEVSSVFTGLSDEVKKGVKPRLFAAKDAGTFKRLQDAEHNLAKVEAGSIASANVYAKFHAAQHRANPAPPKPVNKSVAD